MTKPSQRLWRTLVRVICHDGSDGFWVTLPGFNPSIAKLFPKETFPKRLHSELFAGAHFHCRANIGADNIQDLKLRPPFVI